MDATVIAPAAPSTAPAFPLVVPKSVAASAPKAAAPAKVVKPAVKAAVKKVAKPVVKAAAKPAAKTVAKPAVKSVVAKPAAKAEVKPAPKAAAKPVVKAVAKTKAVAEKAEKPKKAKLVRDSFTIPKPEYLVLEELKQRAAKLAHAVKKSELLRAGIKALAAMSDTALLAALKAVPAIKTGRPGN